MYVYTERFARIVRVLSPATVNSTTRNVRRKRRVGTVTAGDFSNSKATVVVGSRLPSIRIPPGITGTDDVLTGGGG